MKMTNLIIDVHNLQKSFSDVYAVKNISLQVKRGEIFGFLGPNGSGKTTTIRMLCGLLTPDSGSGTCLGYDILTQSSEIKEHVGYIPQYFGLYKQLTVYENLEFLAELFGLIDRHARVKNALEYFQLTKYRDQLAGTLSGGWKQRLSLAAALLHDPFLLLLDEPTASTDPKARRDFWEIIHTLSSEGVTVLLSSHNMDEVERCHRIAYVSEGQLLMVGEIKSFISNINLTTWHVKGNNLTLLAKQLREIDGIDQVITFFDTLHVSSQDEDALMKGIIPYLNNPNYKWNVAETALEDAFVWLAKRSFRLKGK
jgi:ABC-2 type transport system ATP-binding protein